MVGSLILTYALYFALIPVFPIVLIGVLWYEKNKFDFFKASSMSKKLKWRETISSQLKRIKRYEVITIFILLLVLPSWGYFASEVSDTQMHREMRGGTGPMGSAYSVRDPVIESLGPSYDTGSIINEMRSKPDIWLPHKFDEMVDLNDLTDIPGRLAVYRLYGSRYVLTYTYLAPYPIMRAFGFQVIEGDGELLILSQIEKTIVFPNDPGTASRVANI